MYVICEYTYIERDKDGPAQWYFLNLVCVTSKKKKTSSEHFENRFLNSSKKKTSGSRPTYIIHIRV